MYDDILSTIKRAALAAVENSNPMAVFYGTVKSESPLTIAVDQKTPLTKEFLIVPEYLTDHEVTVSLSGWKTQSRGGGSSYGAFDSHDHGITASRQSVTIHNRLRIGDEVVLLRAPGGQKFLVYDRIK